MSKLFPPPFNPVSLGVAYFPLWAWVLLKEELHNSALATPNSGESRADDSETSGLNFLVNRHGIRN